MEDNNSKVGKGSYGKKSVDRKERDRRTDQQVSKKQDTKSLFSKLSFKRDKSKGSASSKQLEDIQSRNYFDFGEPCNECRSAKVTSYKTLKAEMRCFKCFNIKCFDDKCLEDNDCNLNVTMRKRRFEINDTLWRSLRDKKGHENYINIIGKFSDQIHNAVVETTISKIWPKHYDTDNLVDNIMKMEITTGDGKDDVNIYDRQKVYVRLEDGVEMKIGLYEKGGTGLELNLIKILKKELTAIPVQSDVVNDALGYLAKCDDYLIVVCLHQSRLKEDIHYTLENIQEKEYRRVIVVILHYKKPDTDYLAEDLQAEQCYSGLSFIDYFHHEEKENMREVIDKVKTVVLG